MLASILLFSLSALGTAVSASAIPQAQQQDGLVRRQSKIDTATIPTFSYGPSDTVYLGGGSNPNATGSSQPTASADLTSSQAVTDIATTSIATVTGSPAATNASPVVSSTAPGTGGATGTIPTYSFFPSSTVPVGGGATAQPSSGSGADNRTGNGAGNNIGNGASDGTGQGNQADITQNLTELLQSLLDLLGN